MRCGAAIDENIGRLLDYLDKAGLSELKLIQKTINSNSEKIS